MLFSGGAGPVVATAGSVVLYHGDNGVDDNEVVKDYSDGALGAGILISVPAAGEHCWIQIKGPITLTVTFTAAPADGQPFTIGTADGAATKANEADTAAVYVQVLGFAIDASAKKVVLDCPY